MSNNQLGFDAELIQIQIEQADTLEKIEAITQEIRVLHQMALDKMKNMVAFSMPPQLAQASTIPQPQPPIPVMVVKAPNIVIDQTPGSISVVADPLPINQKTEE